MKRLFTLVALVAAVCSGVAQAGKKGETQPAAGPIQVSVKCDRAEYMHGEPGVTYIIAPTGQLKATLTVTNRSDKMQKLVFPSSQKYDFVIRDAQDKEVKRWSAGMNFLMAIQEESLAAGKEWIFTQDLKLGDVGKPLALGSYVLEAVLTCQAPLSARVPFKIVATPVRKPR